MQTHWKLEGTLRRFGKTPMALARASGLTKTTIYNMVNNTSQAVQLETLDKLLIGLENLTGQHFSVADVLEREVKPNALLEALLRDAKPVNFEELNKHIPAWTDEERIENEAFLRELEYIKQRDRAHSLTYDPIELEEINRSSTPSKK
jgi:DNA-binding Xre family transcriptional regulator